jgi:hypothetical protein
MMKWGAKFRPITAPVLVARPMIYSPDLAFKIDVKSINLGTIATALSLEPVTTGSCRCGH